MSRTLRLTLLLLALLCSCFSPLPARASEVSLDEFSALEKLADQGSPTAQFKLGALYFHGAQIAKDYPKAADYLTKAAGQGHTNAAMLLANLYLSGSGVGKDPHKSFTLMRQAAEGGLPGAQAILGIYYSEGTGTPRDPVRGCAWFDVAAAQGVEEAKTALMESIKALTPDQLSEATTTSRTLWQQFVEKK